VLFVRLLYLENSTQRIVTRLDHAFARWVELHEPWIHCGGRVGIAILFGSHGLDHQRIDAPLLALLGVECFPRVQDGTLVVASGEQARRLEIRRADACCDGAITLGECRVGLGSVGRGRRRLLGRCGFLRHRSDRGAGGSRRDGRSGHVLKHIAAPEQTANRTSDGDGDEA
jgi:hypothetical protein